MEEGERPHLEGVPEGEAEVVSAAIEASPEVVDEAEAEVAMEVTVVDTMLVLQTRCLRWASSSMHAKER